MFDWLKPKKKSNNFNSVVSQLFDLSERSGIPNNYHAQAKESYIKNVVAHYCISTIAKSVADIPYILKINGKEQESNQLLELLRRPYPLDSYRNFMRRAITYRLVSGNCYIVAQKLFSGRIAELRLVRPDKVEILVENGRITAYQGTNNAVIKNYTVDPITLESDVIHIKEPHPTDDLKGMSPITAAWLSISQHNNAGDWNNALLDNFAKPSGILTYKNSDKMEAPSAEQSERLSESLRNKMTGKSNAGGVPVIPYEFQWQQLGMSPNDMDWINGKNSNARDIALAFGFPPFLLGLAEGATFNNVSEAKLSLYEETVIPLATDFLEELAWKFSDVSGKEITLTLDLDRVSALSPRHDSYKKNIRDDLAAGIINRNEARVANAYDPIGKEGDEFYTPAGQLPLGFDVNDFAAESDAKSDKTPN